MSDFLLSVPSGEAVALEPFHFAIIGQTQYTEKSSISGHILHFQGLRDVLM
jgi:hypothetical protein